MLIFQLLAGLEDKGKKTKAERIAFDLLEYLDQINYNKYYESMGAVGTRGGEKEKLFSDFSSQSIKAAQVSLQQRLCHVFLGLHKLQVLPWPVYTFVTINSQWSKHFMRVFWWQCGIN